MFYHVNIYKYYLLMCHFGDYICYFFYDICGFILSASGFF